MSIHINGMGSFPLNNIFYGVNSLMSMGVFAYANNSLFLSIDFLRIFFRLNVALHFPMAYEKYRELVQ